MKPIGTSTDLSVGREIAPRRAVSGDARAPTNVRAERVTARDEAPVAERGVVGMRAEAAAHGVAGDVDPQRVAWIRQELSAGRIGGAEDIDRAARALLEELW